LFAHGIDNYVVKKHEQNATKSLYTPWLRGHINGLQQNQF